MRELLGKSRDVLWWLALVFGIAVLVMMIVESILPAVATFYLFIIAYALLFPLYSAFKEVLRWSKADPKAKLGEIFVLIWWSVFFVLGLLEYFGVVQVPQEMLYICGEVVAVWVATEISKKLFAKRRNSG